MKYLLTPIGSAGDVYPFLGIGRELRRRGHEVTILTNGYFEPLVRQMGFAFLPFGTREQYLAALEDPDLWHPRRGLRTVTGLIARQRQLYEDILRLRKSGGAEVVVAHTLALGARVAQEKLAVPVVTVHLSPALFRSEYEVPTMTGRTNLSRTPRWLKRLCWWAADKLVVDPLLCPIINELRAELGLPPVRRIFQQWLHSPLLTLGLFPAWYAPPQPDWPPQVRLSGFPQFDAPGMTAVPAEVERFLDEGAPPVVATPGSANTHARGFFEAVAEACRRLGRRALLLTRFPGQLPAELPEGVRHFDYAPLSGILPRCAAIIHHGGIGTTAAGLAAGVPQVIMPLSHDQPDNAHRVLRLGVGRRVMPRHFRAGELAGELEALLGSGDTQARCRQWAEECRREDGVGNACALIETAAPAAVGQGGG